MENIKFMNSQKIRYYYIKKLNYNNYLINIYLNYDTCNKGIFIDNQSFFKTHDKLN